MVFIGSHEEKSVNGVYMKKIILASLALALAGCGPS
jgi:hypothetical protein